MFNTDDRLLFTATAAGDTNIWVNFTIPFAEICPIFGIYPLIPMAALNNNLQIDLYLNTKIFNYHVTNNPTGLGDKFADFQIKVALFTNQKLIDVVKV